MADETDVEDTLVGLIAAALYPDGTAQPCVAGVPVRIFRGWPSANAQEQAKVGGFVNVSVAARNGVERNTSRYPSEWQTLAPPAKTLTVSVDGNRVSIGGTVSTPQNVAIVTARRAYSYGVQPTDTPTGIATALATLVGADYPGTLSAGPVVTVAGAGNLRARVGGVGTSIRELKRQEKSFQIDIWAPPATLVGQADRWRRDVAKVVVALARYRRIALGDGSTGLIRYERTTNSDGAQEEGLYRRSLFAWVEFPTVETATHAEIIALETSQQGGVSTDSPTRIYNS